MRRHSLVLAMPLLLSVVVLAAETQDSTWSFKWPSARAAKTRYDLRMKKADSVYQAAMKAAQTQFDSEARGASLALTRDLGKSLDEALKVRNLEEANKIDAARKSLENAPLARRGSTTAMGTLDGKWRIRWSDGSVRFHEISTKARTVRSTSGRKPTNHGKLTWVGGMLVGDFGASVVRYHVAGDFLYLEGFEPPSRFPKMFPSQWGRGERVE